MSKNILITGASSGIGKATSVMLSEKGYNCILFGRDEEKLKNVKNLLVGHNHHIVIGDMTDHNSFNKILDLNINFDGIVHSAGIIKLASYKYINQNDFSAILQINLLGPFFLTQLLLNTKNILDGSSIVFLSSISGNVVGSPGNLMYSSSKAALNGIVKTLALELAKKKIRVNSINAGMINSEMWSNSNNFIASKQLSNDMLKYPLGYGEVDDAAALVSFLISDDSKWITGAGILADGGFTTN
jgi:NAD(P)-dependent dehydrogenase (short-subunit alcohol dehydrogenase family)